MLRQVGLQIASNRNRAISGQPRLRDGWSRTGSSTRPLATCWSDRKIEAAGYHHGSVFSFFFGWWIEKWNIFIFIYFPSVFWNDMKNGRTFFKWQTKPPSSFGYCFSLLSWSSTTSSLQNHRIFCTTEICQLQNRLWFLSKSPSRWVQATKNVGRCWLGPCIRSWIILGPESENNKWKGLQANNLPCFFFGLWTSVLNIQSLRLEFILKLVPSTKQSIELFHQHFAVHHYMEAGSIGCDGCIWLRIWRNLIFCQDACHCKLAVRHIWLNQRAPKWCNLKEAHRHRWRLS